MDLIRDRIHRQTESGHDAKFVVIGGTICCLFNNLWCRQWRKVVIVTIPTFQCYPISTNNVSTEYRRPYAPFDTIGVALNLIQGYDHWF